MLLSLPLSLAANAAGIANLLNFSALLVDNVLVRRWHFYNTTGILSSAAEVLCSPSNSQHIISEHTLYHTCTHPSMHIISITVTRTHVCNTVSDTVPALT